MTKPAIVDFFTEVSDRSPIPIAIYNFPNLLSGLDVDCDMLETLGKHENMAAVKLTCGNISKMTRVSTLFDPREFAAVSGQSDLLVAALAAGGAGCISGVVNLFPRVSRQDRTSSKQPNKHPLTPFFFGRSLSRYTTSTAPATSKPPRSCRKRSPSPSGASRRPTSAA